MRFLAYVILLSQSPIRIRTDQVYCCEQTMNAAKTPTLIRQIDRLIEHALAFEQKHRDKIDCVAPSFRASARNLLHYLALRQHDIRTLQDELADLSLSSLGRCEGHTLYSLLGVRRALAALTGAAESAPPTPEEVISLQDGDLLLKEHTRRLFGMPSGKRSVHVMVTMPSEAADRPELIESLLAAGMDVMRINAAHDDADAWLRMIAHLRAAERRLGRSAKVYLDLAGPKLRTGPLEPIGEVIKLRPQRDACGEVVAPLRVRFVPALHGADAASAQIPIEGALLALAEPGDEIRLQDAGGRKRSLRVVAREGDGIIAEGDRTVYFESDQILQLRRRGKKIARARIGKLPPVYAPIQLKQGDRVLLEASDRPGQPARYDEEANLVTPARFSCTLGSALREIPVGSAIWFDDGKIGGRVLANDGRTLEVEITHCHVAGAKLGPAKGINLPGVELSLPTLTEKDRADLVVMANHVDMVGLSFVRHPEDVLLLHDELERLAAGHVGIVLKIETVQGFSNLPKLLLAAMQSPVVGVMVARGDLAVEVGFARLAEVQEEILWLCEAAHVPVIWATQVLESLAKSGAPSRAEVSDAVMSGRAECVMLNKGPYAVDAVRFLNSILERMEAHQIKKRARLRPLSIAHW